MHQNLRCSFDLTLLLLNAISCRKLVVSLNPAVRSIRNRLHTLLLRMFLLRHLIGLSLHDLALVLLRNKWLLWDHRGQGNLVLTLDSKGTLLLLGKDCLRG